MSSIETEHNGYVIAYAENQDVWRCWGLELEAKTLSALKNKINKVSSDARRLDNVEAIDLSETWGKPKPVKIVMLAGVDYMKKPQAWIIKTAINPSRFRGEKDQRQKVALENLVLDTPENQKLLSAYLTKQEAVRAAQEEANKAKAAIPRVTLADLSQTRSEESE